MSITPVPIWMRLVRAPTAASSGNGDASCRAKWWTRKKAPSAPSSPAATARSIDCNRTSRAERVADWGDADQCPNERKPILFMGFPDDSYRGDLVLGGPGGKGEPVEGTLCRVGIVTAGGSTWVAASALNRSRLGL